MRSNISSSTGSSHLSVGKSPVPYLLGGVGAMLILVGFAMIILAWSYFKESITGNAVAEEGGKNERREDMAQFSDKMQEMRVIVIMVRNGKMSSLDLYCSTHFNGYRKSTNCVEIQHPSFLLVL